MNALSKRRNDIMQEQEAVVETCRPSIGRWRSTANASLAAVTEYGVTPPACLLRHPAGTRPTKVINIASLLARYRLGAGRALPAVGPLRRCGQERITGVVWAVMRLWCPGSGLSADRTLSPVAVPAICRHQPQRVVVIIVVFISDQNSSKTDMRTNKWML